MSVSTARTLALSAIGIILAALLAILALLQPLLALVRPRREESASIQARYGRLIVPVAHVSRLPGDAVIDVSDMESLVKIAEHYDRSILYEAARDGDAYWVSDESGQFRYALGAAAVDADASAWSDAHPAPAAWSNAEPAAAAWSDAHPTPDKWNAAEPAPDAWTEAEPAPGAWTEAEPVTLEFDAPSVPTQDELAPNGYGSLAVPGDPDTFVLEGVDRRRTDENGDASAARAPASATYFTGLEWTANS
jgi:hypothetical protein